MAAKRFLWLLIVGLTILLAGCQFIEGPLPTPTPTFEQAEVPASEARAVTIAMGYIPNVQFTPFYVAVENGYFAQEGIEVSFDYGWETDILKLVGTGELSFAVASGDQVILARSQGLPITYVSSFYRRFPVCVVSLEESGIQSVHDLVGKTIGTPVTYGASYIGWLALIRELGMDESEFEVQAIGYTQVASLTEGRVDAAICYAMNEPVQLREEGEEVNVIYVADHLNLVSNGIITNDDTVTKDPRLVQGVVRGFLRGLRYTLDNPDDAFEICTKHVPEIGGDNASVQRAVLEAALPFWSGDPLGMSDASEWKASQEFMREIGLIAEPSPVDRLFSNEFVTGSGVSGSSE